MPINAECNPAAIRANASGLVAVRSTAGSTVENDSMSSLNRALLLNCANGSLSSGGQFCMPLSKPVYNVPFGPSTAAPLRIAPLPSREPTRFAT